MATYDPKQFDWWKDKLAGKDVPIYNDQPMQGYYAFSPGGKAQAPKAVAFFYSQNTGELRCQIEGASIKYGLDIWAQCARNPISYQVYTDVTAGKPWPSEIRIELPGGKADSTLSSSPGIGHNTGNERETFKENLEEWMRRADKAAKLGTPKTQEEADSIADIATKMRELHKEADKARVAETDPLHKAWQAANELWTPWLKRAPDKWSLLLSLGAKFIKEEQARRQAAADAANAELNKQAAAQAGPVETLAPEPPARVVAEPVTIGTRKTVSTVKTKHVVFEDFAKAAAYFCTQENVAPHILEAITKSAFATLNAGVTVPGAKLETKETAR